MKLNIKDNKIEGEEDKERSLNDVFSLNPGNTGNVAMSMSKWTCVCVSVACKE